MTVEVAHGEDRVLDDVMDDVEDKDYLEEYLVTGEGPPPSRLPCLHRWRLNKIDSNVVEADQFATVLALLEAKWTPQNGHDDAFPFQGRHLRVGCQCCSGESECVSGRGWSGIGGVLK
jgi:hypothetical protein